MIKITQRDEGNLLTKLSNVLAEFLYDGVGFDVMEPNRLTYVSYGFTPYVEITGTNLTYTHYLLTGGRVTGISLQDTDGTAWSFSGLSLTAIDTLFLLFGRPGAFLDKLQNTAWDYEGSEQSDDVVGGNMDDVLKGNAGEDFIWGGAGNDRINGGTGYDALYGGSGNDVLQGGPGGDLLTGGTGADFFAFISTHGFDIWKRSHHRLQSRSG